MTRKGNSHSHSFDPERGSSSESQEFTNAFSNASVRNGFIRKVYGILACQFAFTTMVVALMNYNTTIKEFVLNPKHIWIFWVSMVSLFIIYLILACFENCRRTVPNNFMLLFALTICMAVLVGYCCLHYKLDALLIAAGLTFVICLSVSLFSCFTSFDFTKCIWIMFIIFLVFFFAGIILIFIHDRIAHIIYSAIGVAIFTIYLAIDTQLIMGGRRYEISTEEYILAVVHLYLDIIYIFLHILRLIDLGRG